MNKRIRSLLAGLVLLVSVVIAAVLKVDGNILLDKKSLLNEWSTQTDLESFYSQWDALSQSEKNRLVKTRLFEDLSQELAVRWDHAGSTILRSESELESAYDQLVLRHGGAEVLRLGARKE